MLFFPEKNGNASAPMPILPSLGGAASYGLTEDWALELSLDVYGTTYDYDYTLKRVVPANDETRTAFVIGAIWGIQPVYRFRPMGDKFTLRAYGGLGIDTRIVFRAYGLKDSDPHFDANGYTGHTLGETRKNITSYFWGGGRFIFPFVGGGIDFPVMEDVTLGIDLRVWLPLWRIWTGENLPGVEGIRFGAGFRISFL
jgi:hypothetical protein